MFLIGDTISKPSEYVCRHSSRFSLFVSFIIGLQPGMTARYSSCVAPFSTLWEGKLD